ncbi:hypothetical protein AB0H43_14055 [Hamadaea sp. NPDC050747]|uniref:hypothetical protein n=1 Tax=Hamadaea sp. NPDC050747 TaxID=3155789 RepID=UPI0033D36157
MTLTPARKRTPRATTAAPPPASDHTGHTWVRRGIATTSVLVLLASLAGSTAATTERQPQVFIPAAAQIRFPRPTVTHLHYRHWKLDPGQPRHGLVMSDVQLWWAADGTALIQRCDVVEDPKSTRISNPRNIQGPCPDTSHLTWGHYRPRMPHPLPTNVATLRTWLTVFADSSSDHALIAAAVDMLREHHLNPRQRAALLAILADMPAIKYRGTTTDRAGRAGEAFSLDSVLSDGSTITDLLIIDPGDGTLLGYDKVLLTPAPGSELDPMTVVETTIFLESDMTSVIPGTAAMTCDQHACIAEHP